MSKVPLEGKHNVLLRRMSVYGNFKGKHNAILFIGQLAGKVK